MARFKTTYQIHAKTYASLIHTAWHLLDMAERYEEGSLLNLQAATVFSAFAFEAYLNHVGAEELTFWEDIDRIPHKKKLTVLSKHLGFTMNKSDRPFRTISELFQLRNALAHGRTEKLTKTRTSKAKPDREDLWRLLPREKLTAESVRRYHDDVMAAAEQINAARSVPDVLMWNEGPRKYLISSPRSKRRGSGGV